MQDEQANRDPLSQKRHAKDRAKVAEPCGFTEGVFGISQNIRDLNGFAFKQDAPDYTAASRCKRLSFKCSAYSGV